MTRMRLAWFSPVPPVRSGIAACTADLLPHLTRTHQVDVYVDEPVARRITEQAEVTQRRSPQSNEGIREAGGAWAAAVRSAHEFVWRHQRQPYDLTVFLLGNSSHHDYIWPYLFLYPGLTVLHDAHLHHARAASLLRMQRRADYRAEFRANEPDLPAALGELAVAGFDSYLYYLAPMTRLVTAASRLTAVHAGAVSGELRAQLPAAGIETIRLGHGVPLTSAQRAAARERGRRRVGLAADAIVFGVYGGLTPEKRVPQVLQAFAAVRAGCPAARLLLVGAAAAHYDLRADIARHQLGAHVVVSGYLESDDDLTDALAAADVAVNLRWPTAREVSGPWLRALAAGVPTVTMDLAHTWNVPALDPRTWQVNAPTRGAAAVTVAIDILDEDHSLRLAMRRLASDARLRATLAANGRAYWEQEHAIERMVEDYERVLAVAVTRPAPAVVLPPHLVNRGDRALHAILDDLGIERLRARLWSPPAGAL